MTKLQMNNLTENEQKIVKHCIEAYITVMGREKWDNLNAKEQHDVVMTLVNGLLKA